MIDTILHNLKNVSPYRLRNNLLIFVSLVLALSTAGRYEISTTQSSRLLQEARSILHDEPEKASELAQEALALSDISNPDSICSEAVLLAGDAYLLMGNYNLGLRSLDDAELITDSTDTRTRARIYFLQSYAYHKLGVSDKALGLSAQAHALYNAMGDSSGVAQCYNLRGNILVREDPAKSEALMRKALLLGRRIKDLPLVAKALNDLATHAGVSPEDKLQMLDEAIAINKNTNARRALCDNYLNKAAVLSNAGHYDEATRSLQSSYAIIEQLNSPVLLSEYYSRVSSLKAAQGDFQGAYLNLQERARLLKQMSDSNSLGSTGLEIIRKRADRYRLDSDLWVKRYRDKIMKRNLWIFSTIVALLLIGFAIFYFWYKHKKACEVLRTEEHLRQVEHEMSELKIRQKEKELENVNELIDSNRKELIEFAAFLQSRKDLISTACSMLKECGKMQPDDMSRQIRKTQSFLMAATSSDQISESILKSVEIKNKNFIDALLKAHPSLTKGERHLALLVRGGLSSKEISALLFIEPKTVNMNRYRLRKSLGLDTDTDLLDYLRSL